MTIAKRLGVLSLTLALSLSALTSCGGGGNTSSAASSQSASTSAQQAEGMDLSGVTDPYLATAGISADTVVAKVGEIEIPADELLYWINSGIQLAGYSSQPPWDEDLGGGETLADQIKQSALNAAAFYALIPHMAAKEGLSVSPEMLEQIEQQRQEAIQVVGSEEIAEHSFWYQMTSWDMLDKLSQRGDLYMQLQDFYFGPNSDSYPTDAEVLSFAQDEVGLYRAKHILMMTVDPETREPLDDTAVAEKKSQADDILAQIRAADDPVAKFDELMKQFSEDPGLATNPDGYVAQKGQMVPEFEQAALSLKDGEISDVIHSDATGYHIILRLPLDPNEYRGQLISKMMMDKVGQWLEEYGVETTENYDKIDPASFREKVESLQITVKNELSQAIQAQQDAASSSSSSAS